MVIDGQGDVDVDVSDVLRNGLNVCAGTESRNHIGMPKIVEANRFK